MEIRASGALVRPAEAEALRCAGLQLSRITFGTMRLDRAGDEAASAALLSEAFGAGISSLHVSSEYETYPLFRDAWARARPGAPGEITFIAKVASPHFGEEAFDAAQFRRKVESYLQELKIEKLDVVQWLLRHDLGREEGRQRIARECSSDVARVVEDLTREGKIGALVAFPYTNGVAELIVAEEYCQGLAVYVNPLEHEMDRWLTRASSLGKDVVAIRPFAAGRLFSETALTTKDALDYVFGFEAVCTAVVSFSRSAHIEAVCTALSAKG